MIFTSCPYCDHSFSVGYECGDRMGHIPFRCSNCEKVIWVELISFGGVTRTHEAFKNEIMHEGDEEEIEAGAKQASYTE